jgi:hypothetical protein
MCCVSAFRIASMKSRQLAPRKIPKADVTLYARLACCLGVQIKNLVPEQDGPE